MGGQETDEGLEGGIKKNLRWDWEGIYNDNQKTVEKRKTTLSQNWRVNAYSIKIYSRRIYPGLLVNKRSTNSKWHTVQISTMFNSPVLKDTQSKSQSGLTLQF